MRLLRPAVVALGLLASPIGATAALADDPPALAFSFRVDRHFQADRFGRLFVGATVRCNHAASYQLLFVVRERVGTRQASAFTQRTLPCPAGTSRWTQLYVSQPVAFRPAHEALVHVGALAGDGTTQVLLPDRDVVVPIRRLPVAGARP